MNTNQATTSHERAVTAASGWVMLPTLIVLFIGDVALILLELKPPGSLISDCLSPPSCFCRSSA